MADFLPAAIVFSILAAPFFTICTRFTGMARRHAAMLWVGSLVLAAAITAYRIAQTEGALRGVRGREEMEYFILLASGFLLVPMCALLAGKLYHRWIGGHFTLEEKASGAVGVRAWLKGGNLVVAALISLFAWLGYGYSFAVILMVTVGALLAYPLLNFSPSSSGEAPKAAPEIPQSADISGERERILKMVEEGKITAADSATLLAAMGAVRSAPRPGAAVTPERKLVCAGAALVLAGFFLPWFSFNAGDELKHGMNQAAQQFGQVVPDFRGSLPSGGMTFDFKTPSIHRNGGEMPHGLGWMALVIAVGVAGLPLVAATMAHPLQRTLSIVALGVGAFALFYLLTQDARHVGIGLILAIAGYAIEFVGTMRERHARGW